MVCMVPKGTGSETIMDSPKNVIICGSSERVGDWVILDSSMTRVLGAAPTPEEALLKAGIDNGSHSDDNRPVMMQVPDHSLTCLY